jgi:hypothetical protein
MDVRGLTLRSKASRRPQISAPKPIPDPHTANKSSAPDSGRTTLPTQDRHQQSGATSDLVKRRYSTRYNQLPNFEVDLPAVPGLPSAFAALGAGQQSSASNEPVSSSSQPLRVDLNALRDPNLPVDQCTFHDEYLISWVTILTILQHRCHQPSGKCVGAGYTGVSEQP